MSSRLRVRSLLLPLASLGLLVAQLINPAPTWKGLLVALAGLWLVTYLWARALRRNLRLDRAMRFGWAQVGDKLEEQFTLQNDGWLPATWLEITDGSTLPGYSIARGTGIDGNSQFSWLTAGMCTRRGVYTLGHTRLRSGDPLGLFEVQMIQPESVTVTVMPPIVPLPFMEITAGGWQGEGRPRIRQVEQTVSAETVRPYVPGDSLRLLHWPTSARREEPYVRVLQGAPASDWWIALDLEGRVQVGAPEWESSSELGVILAASLADRGLRSHRAVGIVAGGQQPVWIKPGFGEQQRWEIMRTLAMIQTGNTNLTTLLEQLGPVLRHRATLFVVTPSTALDWSPALTRLIGRGITVTALLIDPASFGARSSVDAVRGVLDDIGAVHHTLGKELFERPEVRPGPSGQWEWRLLPTGKAVPVKRPADMSWKSLR